MQIVGAIIIGAIMGAIARLVAPSEETGGFILTILVGIAGGVTGVLGGGLVGWNAAGFTVAGAFASGMGAMLWLLAFRALASRRRTGLR